MRVKPNTWIRLGYVIVAGAFGDANHRASFASFAAGVLIGLGVVAMVFAASADVSSGVAVWAMVCAPALLTVGVVIHAGPIKARRRSPHAMTSAFAAHDQQFVRSSAEGSDNCSAELDVTGHRSPNDTAPKAQTRMLMPAKRRPKPSARRAT
jgi:hypothetical protein